MVSLSQWFDTEQTTRNWLVLLNHLLETANWYMDWWGQQQPTRKLHYDTKWNEKTTS
jgi:hypothetical protein